MYFQRSFHRYLIYGYTWPCNVLYLNVVISMRTLTFQLNVYTYVDKSSKLNAKYSCMANNLYATILPQNYDTFANELAFQIRCYVFDAKFCMAALMLNSMFRFRRYLFTLTLKVETFCQMCSTYCTSKFRHIALSVIDAYDHIFVIKNFQQQQLSSAKIFAARFVFFLI